MLQGLPPNRNRKLKGTIMPLEFRRQRNGRIRHIWFVAFKINGKRQWVNLGVKVAGTPPASHSFKDKGDTEYDVRARRRRQSWSTRRGGAQKRSSAHLVEKLYEIKTGESIKSVKLG